MLGRIDGRPRLFRLVGGGLLLFCIGATLVSSRAEAAVTFQSQRRDVMTFALVDIPDGNDLTCSDQVISLDPGVFAETVECPVGDGGSYAHGLAGQLSYLFPQHFIAEGSFSAEAEIAGDVQFAEGLGSSRFVSEFSVDTDTEIHLTALLTTLGGGSTNFVFRLWQGEIYIYRSIQGDNSDEVDEVLNLAPGTYELTLTTSGYGQGLPDGSGVPSSGSFSAAIEFPTTAIDPNDLFSDSIAPRLLAAPNPIRNATHLLLSGDSQVLRREVVVSDATGRLIRRFDDVGPEGVTWDARDENGHRVAAGIYLARAADGRATRLTVLR